MLAEYGVVMVSAGVDKGTATIVQPVAITVRGWFVGANDGEVVVNLTTAVRNALQEALAEDNLDADSLSKVAQRAAGRLLGQRYRRQPVILSSVVVL